MGTSMNKEGKVNEMLTNRRKKTKQKHWENKETEKRKRSGRGDYLDALEWNIVSREPLQEKALEQND